MNTCYRQKEKYKEKIRERDNHTCQLCGEPAREVDHIIPWAVSHDSSESNLRVLYVRCNTDTRRPRKDAALPYNEWTAWLESELLRR